MLPCMPRDKLGKTDMSKHKVPIRVASADPLKRTPSPESENAVAASKTLDTAAAAVSDELTAKEWQDRALRLQAEMENYRKRQQRRAQEQVRAEQERLLDDVFTLADNLERTLDAAEEDSPVRDGVALTYDELLRVLRKYGVERIDAEGEPFDPTWHEAVGVVSANGLGVEVGIVVSEAQAGYRRDGRLLRPARVIVAN
jgi:molecular chaperone GrpE